MTQSWKLGRLACAGGLLLLAAASLPAQPAKEQPATIIVQVPPDATIEVDGTMTKSTGPIRRFYSPPLAVGKTYHYHFKVTYGDKSTREEKVKVQAGSNINLDLRPKADGRKPPDRDKDKDKDKGKDKDADKDKGKDKDTDGDKELDVPYVPTPKEVVKKMLELAKVGKDDVVYDLGCGDGRIVVMAAKDFKCKSAMGFDLDPDRIKDSKKSVAAAKVGEKVTIVKKDIFKVDLKPATVVTMYLLPAVNEKMVPQLQKMKPGSRVVSHDFEIAGYKPDRTVKIEAADDRGDRREHTIYVFTIPLKKEKE
jgi:uncharacterized protein (TIGR03000 family)